MLDGRLPLLPNAGIQVVDVRDVSAAHIAAMDDPATIGERYIVADEFYWLREMAALLREALPERRKIPSRGMPDFLVRVLALVSGDVETIASELHKRRILASEKVRKLLGRDLIPADQAIRASAATLIRYGAVWPAWMPRSSRGARHRPPWGTTSPQGGGEKVMAKVLRTGLAGTLALMVSAAAGAAPVYVGDLPGPGAQPDALVRVESSNGTHSDLATGVPLWTEALDLDTLPGGDVAVLDLGGPSTQEPEGLFRFDAGDGSKSPITTAANLWIDPLGLAGGPAGELIVLDQGGPSVFEVPALLRFDSATGARTVLASSTSLWTDPRAFDVGPTSHVIVLDRGGPTVPEAPGLYHFDAVTGTRTALTTGTGLWIDPVAMAVGPDGDVVVLDLGGPSVFEAPALLRFDGTTGARSVLASGFDLWRTPRDLDVLPNGDVVVLEPGGPSVFELPALLRFDGEDGTRTLLSDDPSLWSDPYALAVPEPASALVTLVGCVVALGTARLRSPRRHRPRA